VTAEAGGRPRRAVVTGASRGIGRAIATRLARDGFDLLLAARDEPALRAAADELGRRGVRVEIQPTDAANVEDIEALADRQRQFGAELDVLVLAAGVGSAGPIEECSARSFGRQMAINLRAPFRLVQLLLPALRAAAANRPAAGAKIIAIASITGVAAEPDLAAYGASKAALISLCESVTVSEHAAGVSATAISPGFVDTDMARWMHDRLPPAEMISVDDVVEMACAAWRLSRYAVAPNLVLTRPGPSLWRA
jgi:3-oxoacyl-[acyl-carrier protein] reductase